MKNHFWSKTILIVTLLGTAVGSYFLYGSKDALKNRKKIKAWSLKAREKISDKYEELKKNIKTMA